MAAPTKELWDELVTNGITPSRASASANGEDQVFHGQQGGTGNTSGGGFQFVVGQATGSGTHGVHEVRHPTATTGTHCVRTTFDTTSTYVEVVGGAAGTGLRLSQNGADGTLETLTGELYHKAKTWFHGFAFDVRQWILGNGKFRLGSNVIFGWASGDPYGTGMDTGFVRAAAGVVLLTDELSAPNRLRLKKYTTITGRPAAPPAGFVDLYFYNDGTSERLESQDSNGDRRVLSGGP